MGEASLESTRTGEKNGLRVLNFAEIHFGSKEQQEGEGGEKSYCKVIFHGHPSTIQAEIGNTKLGILEQIREPSCDKSPSLYDEYVSALQ